MDEHESADELDLSATAFEGPERKPDVEALLAENRRLREEMARLSSLTPRDNPTESMSHSKSAKRAQLADRLEVDAAPEVTLAPAPSGYPQSSSVHAIPRPSQGRGAQPPRRPHAGKVWSPSGKDPAAGIQPSPTLLGGSYAMGYRGARNLGNLSRQNAGAVSLPAIGTAKTSAASGRTREKRKDSDTLENLRQALITSTGGLKQAYRALDVKKTGKVDAETLNMALEDIRFQHPHVHALPSVRAVFEAMQEDRRGMLSLQKLLNFSPLSPTDPSKDGIRQRRLVDTHALWNEYSRKSSAQPVTLERQPRWGPLPTAEHDEPSSQNDAGMLWDMQLEAKKRRKDLRKQFREDRQGIKAEQKRELIQGLVPLEETNRHVEQEQRKFEGHRQRIQEAIKGCSKARFDLIEMQRQMAVLNPEDVNNCQVAVAMKSLFRKNVPQEQADELKPSIAVRALKDTSTLTKSVAFERVLAESSELT
eukprot:TRINITY_DN63736_c0_g1_i1.p1 TRINITY_DN63736_c0_g1~~TRINITY_DN63736_c0_g1_i1.p1  ORF type:complete len:502 (+),score=94.35 TRINITY_DN63736_c0_g1_i1:74-1507(+)